MSKTVTKHLFVNGYSFFQKVFCKLCWRRQLHTYRCVVLWDNVLEFSDHLVNSVTYNNHGLLVLNKPYGVTFSRNGVNGSSTVETKPNAEDFIFKKDSNPTKQKEFKSSYATSGCVSEKLNLVDTLPYLKQHFGFEKLHISRVPEKYCSGVAILTTSKELVTKVNKSHIDSQTGKDKYLAIVSGVPRFEHGKVKLGFKLEEDPKLGKRVVLLKKWSNNAYKRGEVRIGTFHFKTISKGYKDLTSLIEIRVDLRKYHAYRVFCADYLMSPILGDNLFGSRVQTVMGVPVSVNHFSEIANSPQKLHEDVYNLLELNREDAAVIPVQIHLEEMLLPKLLEGKKDVLLRALPPHHFQWTCEKLGLSQPDSAEVAVA